MDADATIHTDGAARGNPGPAAWAFVIARPGAAPVERYERMGTATNNVAEYTALIRALVAARQEGLRRLDVFSDSELMVKQISGEYAVKNAELRELYDEAKELMRAFASVRLRHVRRAENRRADQLCNEALDDKPAAPRHAGTGAPTSTKTRRGPSTATLRERVDEDAVRCLRAAADAWKAPQAAVLTAEQVWDQLWSVLEEAGVLKAPRPKRT